MKRDNLGRFVKGHTVGKNSSRMLGKKHSQQTIEKMRQTALVKGTKPLSRKGCTLTKEQRNNLSLAHKGQLCYWKGKKLSEEHRKNIGIFRKGKGRIPIELLKKPIRKLLMGRWEYADWRKRVFKRDNYTCIWCKQKGGKLNADHIIPWVLSEDLRYKISNGRTLCIDCHKKTDTYGYRSKEQVSRFSAFG